jgi:hypothetical protein
MSSDDDMIEIGPPATVPAGAATVPYGPPAPVQLGPALPFVDAHLTNFLQRQIAGGASDQPGSHFSIAPGDEHNLYDHLTATLAPYISNSGMALARTTVNGVPLTLSLSPTTSQVMIMLEGKFG